MSLPPITQPTKDNTNGLILAGGRSTRFYNQDKAFLSYKNTTLVEHAIEQLREQTSSIKVSANRHLEFYKERNIDYIEDKIEGYAGPLAGVHAALADSNQPWLACIACDTPCFPNDYVARLSKAAAKNDSLIAVARSQDRLQNISMLIHQSLFDSLDKYLNAGERKVQLWLETLKPSIVDFNEPSHAFFNVNTPEQLQQLEKLNCDK